MRYADAAYAHICNRTKDPQRASVLDRKAEEAGFSSTPDYIHFLQGTSDTRSFVGKEGRVCWVNGSGSIYGWNHPGAPERSTVIYSRDAVKEFDNHLTKEYNKLGSDVKERGPLSEEERTIASLDVSSQARVGPEIESPPNNATNSVASDGISEIARAQASANLSEAKKEEAAAREALQSELKQAQAEKDRAETDLREALKERDKAQEDYFKVLKERDGKDRDDLQAFQNPPASSEILATDERAKEVEKSEDLKANVTASNEQLGIREDRKGVNNTDQDASLVESPSSNPGAAINANKELRQDQSLPMESNDRVSTSDQTLSAVEDYSKRLEYAEGKLAAAYDDLAEVQDTTSQRVLAAADRLDNAAERLARTDEVVVGQDEARSLVTASQPSSTAAAADPRGEPASQSADTTRLAGPGDATALPTLPVSTTAQADAPANQADPVSQPDQSIPAATDKSAPEADSQTVATTDAVDRINAGASSPTPAPRMAQEGGAPTPQADPMVEPSQPISAAMNGSATEADSRTVATTQAVDSLNAAWPPTPAPTMAEEGAPTTQADPVAEPSQPNSATTDGSSIEAALQMKDTAGAVASFETSSSLPTSASTTAQTEQHNPQPDETERVELGSVEQQNEPDAATFSALAQDRAALGDAESATLCNSIAVDFASISPDAATFQDIANAKAASGDIGGAELCIALGDDVSAETDNAERSSLVDETVSNVESLQRSQDEMSSGTSDLQSTFGAEEQSGKNEGKEGESEWAKEMTDSRSALYEAFRDAAYEGLKSAELGPSIGQAGL